MEPGSIVTASGVGPAGAIKITAGKEMNIDGQVLSESTLSGTGAVQPRGGGPITLVSGCALTISDTGKVSSKGQDPGADLVHLEACEVVIYGLVQSITTAGHALPDSPPNHCNDDNVIAHPLDGATGYTACVEVWANNITIDNTGTHNGEISVDGVRAPMRGWADLFAFHNITFIGDTNDYLVHGNAEASTNTFGALITVKAKTGKVQMIAEVPGQLLLAIQANIPPSQVSGQNGGHVIIEAGGTPTIPDPTAGDVSLGTAAIEAIGKPGTNVNDAGGIIEVRSFQGKVTGSAPGYLDAHGDSTTNPGLITLTACLMNPATTYPVATNTTPTAGTFVTCPGPTMPTFPANVTTFFTTAKPLWDACAFGPGGKKSGVKFNDLAGNGIKDPTDPLLDGWVIHLIGPLSTDDTPQTTGTTGPGQYTFIGLPAGTYTVCEELKAGWTQTFPTVVPPPVGETLDTTVCAAHGYGPRGYTFTIVTGNENLQNNDFGNFQPPVCEKQPVQAVLAGRIPDVIVRTDLGQSIQTAVTNATDSNHDGSIIVFVINNGSGLLGGHVYNQKVVISQYYPQPFLLIGCSVTLHNPTSNNPNPVILIDTGAGSPGNIFLMDLHAADSTGPGIEVRGDGRTLRNEQATNNAIGIKITGSNNLVHNGAATGNKGYGVLATGNSNLFQDTDSFANTSDGFHIVGSSNTLNKLDAGDKGKGNKGDGVNVIGDGNTLYQIGAFANSLNGIEVMGDNNILNQNVAGDKGKGNLADGIHVTGSGNQLTSNSASANKGDGYDISGGNGSANSLMSNKSNTSTSGNLSYENSGAEYRLKDNVTNNGGNLADSIPVPKTTVTTKCNSSGTQFPATTTNFGAVQACE
jgi:hypothetical protein